MGCGRLHLARSLHRRNDEFGAFLDARGPARGHGLGLGIKAHGVGPVLVEVAEARALPAAEGVIGERHRNPEVPAAHADLDAGTEAAGLSPSAAEDCTPLPS